MHIIMSKLTNTKRKVTYLKRSASFQSKEDFQIVDASVSQDTPHEDLNLSNLDSGRSDDQDCGDNSTSSHSSQ